MDQRGEGIKKQNNKAIVFDLMCKMSQPIRTTNDVLRQIVKTHRSINLTYNQMRIILESLYGDGKITIEKQGNLSLISTILQNDKMSFSQPLEHKKHNTPPYVYDWYKIITRDTKQEGISMEEMAVRLFYNSMKPNEFSEDAAERKVRDIATGYRRRKYLKRNGMPFERYICIDLTGGRGYYLPTKEEVDIDLQKKKKKALIVWQEYWNAVEQASLDQQVRYVATENEQYINQAVKKELE